MEEKYSELQKNLLDRKINDVSELTNIRRLRKYIKELAIDDNTESLNLLEKIYSEYGRLKPDRKNSKSFHCLDKSEIYNALYLDHILNIVYQENTENKNNFLFRLGSQYKEYTNYKLKVAIRMFSPEYVFENYSKDFIEYTELSTILLDCYEARNTQSDTERKWDKRWSKFFLENYNGAWAISIAFPLLYDDDLESWSKLLSICKISPRENYNNDRQFRQDCTFYCNLLKIAYKNNHPEKKNYYTEFIKQGCPKDLLDKWIYE